MRIRENDRRDEWTARKAVAAQGYKIMFELPRDVAMSTVKRLNKFGYAVPVIAGKAYVAVEEK